MINSIQILRGLAASLVVFSHCYHDVSLLPNNNNIIHSLFTFGTYGVDLFFIISGFIMIYVHYDDFKKPNSSYIFLKKRILRIAPLYWIFTILATLILILLPDLFSKGKEFEFDHFIYSLLLLPSYNSIGELFPIIGVGWSLNVEMYFYLIFTFSLFFSRKYFLLILFSVLTIGMFLNSLFITNIAYLDMIDTIKVYEFLLGTILGFLFKNNIKLYSSKLLLSLAILIFLSNLIITYSSNTKLFTVGFPLFILLYAVLYMEINLNKMWNPLLLVGNASYSIYITHIFIYKIPIKLLNDLNHILLILISVLSSITVDIIVYKFIENPLNIYTKKLFFNKENHAK